VPLSFLHPFTALEVLPGLTATGRAEVMVDQACRWEIARIRLGDSEVDLAAHGAAIWQAVHDAILDDDEHRRDIRREASRVLRHEMARLEAAQQARDKTDPFARFEDQAA
jgi:hypothetical protein